MMVRSFKSVIVTEKNRLRRRSGKIWGDIVKAAGLIITVGGLGVLMVYFYNVTLTASYFHVADIIVRGTDRVAERDVLRLSEIGPHHNILTLPVQEISRKVETNPWIKTASVGREFPDRIVIEVVERQPASLILLNGVVHIMDWDGTVFKKLKDTDDVRLPVVNGLYKNKVLDKALVSETLILMNFLKSSTGFPEVRHISEIYGDERYGFSLYTRGGLCLHFGFGNYDRKMERLKPVLRDLARKNVPTEFLIIDLTDLRRVVVKQNAIVRQSKMAEGYDT